MALGPGRGRAPRSGGRTRAARGESAGVRNRRLHDALRDFALEAAALLSADLANGAELSFDVEETGGRGGVLYSYRPLTAEFIAPRWPRLRALPSFGPAAAALGSGAAAYLRLRGVAGDDPEPALRALLERLYEDATSFEFPEERFERVYAEVEQTLYEHALRLAVVAPLRGLRLESERVELGDGLALARGDWTDAPPEAVWPAGGPPPDGEAQPNVVCLWEEDADPRSELPIAEAASRFETLAAALRLFKPGGIALGPSGWARADDGPWRRFPLAAPGAPRGAEWLLTREEEDELREFLGIVAGASPGGPVAWALERFLLGCARPDPVDGLTDHLLALGALLGDGDDTGRHGVALRVAALCAEEQGRRAVQRRVEEAYAIERWAIRGGDGAAYAQAAGPEPPEQVAAEIEQYLRALLRDVLCGYLDPDLRSVADELLLRASEPYEIEARDLRRAAAEEAEPDTDELFAAEDEAPTPAAPAAAAPGVAPAEPAPSRRRPPRSQLATSPPAGAPPEPPEAIRVRRLGMDPRTSESELDERAEPEEGEIEPITAEFAAVSRQASVAGDGVAAPGHEEAEPGWTARPADGGAEWDYDDPDGWSAPV